MNLQNMTKETKMFLIIIVIAAVAISMFGKNIGKEGTVYQYKKEGVVVTATVENGANVRFKLPSNPTTGYMWVLEEESEIFAPVSEDFIEGEVEGDKTGASGVTEIVFSPLNEGTDTIPITYKQNWEGGEIGDTYELTISIKITSDDKYEISDVDFRKVAN